MRHLTSTDFDSILSKAHGNPTIWELFLSKLTKEVCCDSGFILLTDLAERDNTRFLYQFNVSSEHKVRYEKLFNSQDTFNYFIAQHPRSVFCSQDLDNTPLGDKTDSDFITTCGYQFRLGLSISCNQRFSLNLLLNRSNAFTEQEKQRYQQILYSVLPQLEEAIYAEQRRILSNQIIHQIGRPFDGYVVVDNALQIAHLDPVYHSVIAGLDGVNITASHFEMECPEVQQCLLSEIGNACQTGVIQSRYSALNIMIIPVTALANLMGWECREDGIILTFTRKKENNLVVDRLTRFHNLSLCEAACASQFLITPSIAEIASSIHRSEDTVRNHIKRTMHKFDVHNQATLMKKLLAVASI